VTDLKEIATLRAKEKCLLDYKMGPKSRAARQIKSNLLLKQIFWLSNALGGFICFFGASRQTEENGAPEPRPSAGTKNTRSSRTHRKPPSPSHRHTVTRFWRSPPLCVTRVIFFFRVKRSLNPFETKLVWQNGVVLRNGYVVPACRGQRSPSTVGRQSSLRRREHVERQSYDPYRVLYSMQGFAQIIRLESNSGGRFKMNQFRVKRSLIVHLLTRVLPNPRASTHLSKGAR